MWPHYSGPQELWDPGSLNRLNHRFLRHWEQWAVEDSDSDTGEDMKLRAIRGLCKRQLLIIHAELLTS